MTIIERKEEQTITTTVNVLNRWSGKVQFTAEIECAVNASLRVKLGLAVRWAYLRDADLSDADLSGADLNGAVLSGADLSGADLSGAVLRDADLSDADLSGADLNGAVLSGAVLSGAVLSGAAIIPNIDAAILASIKANKEIGKNGLDMGSWHGGKCDEKNWCETTHCRAGYAICLAGKAGFALERKVGAAVAGALIYAASRPGKRIPNFYASNADAMADLEACAKEQTAGEQES